MSRSTFQQLSFITKLFQGAHGLLVQGESFIDTALPEEGKVARFVEF
jgi:hypothetical protein